MRQWEWFLAGLALITGVWSQLRSIASRFFGLVIVTRRVEHQLGAVLAAYLSTCAWHTGGDAYGADVTYVNKLDRVHRVIYQTLYGSRCTFWLKGRPLWFKPLATSADEVNSALNTFTFTFSFVRGTLDWEDLLLRATEWEASNQTNYLTRKHKIIYHFGSASSTTKKAVKRGSTKDDDDYYRPDFGPTRGVRLLHWKLEDLQEKHELSLDTLSLRPELIALYSEIKFWHDSKQWYRERGIPWRRGYVFHGQPGTGKTIFSRAIAERLNMVVNVLDLPSMTNQELRGAWQTVAATAPCIVLLEDLDGVFDGRKNLTGIAGGVTFDTLLNCIDGIERTDGVMLIVTTNHLDKLDPALAHREGRVDRLVEFLSLNLEGRKKLALRILKDEVLAHQMAVEHPDLTATQFQERCFRAALAGWKPSQEPYR